MGKATHHSKNDYSWNREDFSLKAESPIFKLLKSFADGLYESSNYEIGAVIYETAVHNDSNPVAEITFTFNVYSRVKDVRSFDLFTVVLPKNRMSEVGKFHINYPFEVRNTELKNHVDFSSCDELKEIIKNHISRNKTWEDILLSLKQEGLVKTV